MAQSIMGKIVDTQGREIAFANVITVCNEK